MGPCRDAAPFIFGTLEREDHTNPQEQVLLERTPIMVWTSMDGKKKQLVTSSSSNFQHKDPIGLSYHPKRGEWVSQFIPQAQGLHRISR